MIVTQSIIILAAGLLCPLAAGQNSITKGANGSIVNLGYAQYQGVYNNRIGVTTFFGIPYAQAPTGQLRWQAPQDIELNNNYSNQGVIDATNQGPQCVQGYPTFLSPGAVPQVGVASEDCLLLDVLIPTQPASASLPVMVQVHGGGYTLGNSESSAPGYAMVNQSNGGLIYVSIQYRLGPYGFLSSAEIRENGVANAGLLDQRAALNWVQRNIRAFGGDPARVTINGGSAGGGSVMNQMILYGGTANPPFRAVIAEYPWWQPYHNNSVLEYQYRELLNATGCNNLQCLRSISSAALQVASQATYDLGYYAQPVGIYGYGDFYYGPSVDGEIIRDLPSNEFKQGHFSKVPLLTDREAYEGAIFSNVTEMGIMAETADLQQLFPYAKQSFFSQLYGLYPASDFNSTFFQRQTLFGDFIINCPTYYMSSAVSDWGQPVYKMIFNSGSQLHAATAPFLYTINSTTGASLSNNETLARIMKDYFISFATTLDPNTISYSGTPKPYWPLYETPASSGFSIMYVNYTMMGATPDYDVGPRCDFFHGQSYVVRN